MIRSIIIPVSCYSGVIPNKPASCELVAAFPGSGVTFNCMAADKYGFIYTIEYNSRILYRFDP